MSSWLHATPEILFALALLVIPGLILALCLRFRPFDAVGLSVPLSLGTLALANEASSHAKISWGLPIVTGTTVLLAAMCAIAVPIGERIAARRKSIEPADADAADARGWSRREHAIAGLVTLGAALVGAVAVARGIGTPASINQTFDGVFHVNSINAIAQARLASSSVFSGMANPGSGGGFYPPTFGAIGGLVVIYTHVNAINAANIVALAMAMVWPVTVSIAVRRIARPTVFGYAIAMVGAVTIALFPALLLRFGTLWPNALSYLALAPALVVLLRLFGLDREGGALGARSERMPWWPTLIVAAISLPGLALAHPGAVFLVFYLAMPILIWIGWRRFVTESSGGLRAKTVGAVGTLVVVGLFFVGVVWASYRISTVASVRHQYWPPHETWDQAIGQVLLLGTELSSPNAAMAILVVTGLYAALRHGSGRFLIACYLIVGTLAVLSASIETPSTMRWTGFWYNDPFRIFAALAVIVLPLVALGADALRDRLRDLIERLLDLGSLRWPSTILTTGLAAGLVVVLGVLAFQGGLGTRRISNVIAMSYAQAPRPIVNADEAAMLKRLAQKAPAGVAIAGDPFTGEILAGVLSGHPVIYPTFSQPRDADLVLLGTRFDQYRSNPAVCTAVKRLNIGIVVTGRHFFMETPGRRAWFAGFANLATVPGLTKIDSGGGATAYRVASCRG